MMPCSAVIPAAATTGAQRRFERALFLDRDGVINVNHGYVHTPEATDWVPGIFELCRRAADLGHALIVVTNQAGIGRGLYTAAQFETYTQWMLGQFAARGIEILAVYHCPHHPTAGVGDYRRDCECRKPAPGMLLAAARDYGIDLQRSTLVGDKCSDMQAGRSAGVGRLVLLSSTETCTLSGGAAPVQFQDLDQVRAFIAEPG